MAVVKFQNKLDQKCLLLYDAKFSDRNLLVDETIGHFSLSFFFFFFFFFLFYIYSLMKKRMKRTKES